MTLVTTMVEIYIALVNTLYDAEPANTDYNADSCQASAPSGGSLSGSSGGASGSSIGAAGNHACCNWDDFMWAAYDTLQSCCSTDGVKDFGTC